MKHFIALLLVTFSLSLVHGDETDSYIEKYHKIFSGIWIDGDFLPNSYHYYSWGKSESVRHGSIIIDLKAERPFIHSGDFPFYILDIYKVEENLYAFECERNSQKYIFTFYQNKGVLWYIDGKGMFYFGSKNRPVFRIDGPTDKLYITTGELKLRDKASINSKVITEIKRGEKIKVFSKVKKATIKGITGYWVRVKTEDGTIGWCFDANIKELE